MSGPYEYLPGSSRLVVSPTCGLLTPDAALASRLWPLIARGAPLSGLLEEALREGLARLPDLVLFELSEDAVRVLVRGELTATVQSVEGSTTECDGRAVRTWHEQVFGDPVLLTAGEELTTTGLPLALGSVLAAGFRWTPDGTVRSPGPSDSGEDRPPVVRTAVAMSKHSVPAAVEVTPPDPVEPRVSAPPTVAAPTVAAPTVAPPTMASPPAPVSATPVGRSGLPDTRVEPIDESFGHLFESTVIRSVEDAAVRAADEEAPAPDVAWDPGRTPGPADRAAGPGDHDGSTVMAGELAALLGATGDPAPEVFAASGHRVLLLQLSTGQTVEVDRGVVIGRRPQVDRVSGTDIPHLITVPSPQQDISRSHVAVRPGVTGCVAVDLGSTNGSVVRRVGGAQVMLIGGASLDLQVGDTIDLGDGVTATLRAPS